MPRQPRSEEPRIVVHVPPVSMGLIDLLIEDGHYRTRADFLRSAVHHRLHSIDRIVDAAVKRRGFVVGRIEVDGRCEPVVKIVGIAVIRREAVGRLKQIVVYGTVEAEPGVIEALGDRLVRRAYAVDVGWLG